MDTERPSLTPRYVSPYASPKFDTGLRNATLLIKDINVPVDVPNAAVWHGAYFHAKARKGMLICGPQGVPGSIAVWTGFITDMVHYPGGFPLQPFPWLGWSTVMITDLLSILTPDANGLYGILYLTTEYVYEVHTI